MQSAKENSLVQLMRAKQGNFSNCQGTVYGAKAAALPSRLQGGSFPVALGFKNMDSEGQYQSSKSNV